MNETRDTSMRSNDGAAAVGGPSLFGRGWSSASGPTGRSLTDLLPFIFRPGRDGSRGSALLFGMSTMALPAWDQEGEAAQSVERLGRVSLRSAQGPSACSPRPSSREGHRPPGRISECCFFFSQFFLLLFSQPFLLLVSAQAAGLTCLVQRKSVPSRHIRCMMTASLRASATIARRWPRRFATAIAQAFSQDHFATRVSNTCAAS
jgi:hypothetical protein